MTQNLNVIMMGLKETDAVTTMHLLGSHLLKRGYTEDVEDDSQLGLQSCFRYLPVKCILGPEAKDIMELNFKKNTKGKWIQ